MDLFSTAHGCAWLYLAVPGFTWLCPAIPGCTLVCHDLPFHRMPHSATDWPKCFCIYRFKCSKAISEWIDGWVWVWKSVEAPLLRAPEYGNVLKHKLINTQVHIYTRKYIYTSSKICEEIELKAIGWSVEYSNKDLFPSAGIQQVPRYWISIQFILKFIENSPLCSADILKALASAMMRRNVNTMKMLDLSIQS